LLTTWLQQQAEAKLLSVDAADRQIDAIPARLDTVKGAAGCTRVRDATFPP